MRALILHGPGDLRLEDVPDPVPGPGEIVVAVDAALTCATDAKMLRAGATRRCGPLPAPSATRSAGAVAAVGPGVDGVRGGDRVVVANSAPCGRVPRLPPRGGRACAADLVYLTGTFAERAARAGAASWPATSWPCRRGCPPSGGAMAEPLACAVHTVDRSARRAR